MDELYTVVSFDAFGARIRIQAPERIAESLSLRLPPRARTVAGEGFDTVYTVHDTLGVSSDGSLGFRITRDGQPAGWFSDLDAVRFELESDMHFRVAVAAKHHVFVHAGVVEDAGRAVVMPGRTLAGKSSLVLALVAAGATYYSDEFAVIDRDGLVHAYRKPLSERVPDQLRPLHHTLEQLGVEIDATPLSVGLTVITSYREGASWAPEPVTRAQAMMALFDNTVVARKQPEFALEVLAKAVSGSEGVTSERGDAVEAAAGIMDALRPPRD